MSTTEWITIDGAMGEGGGQIIRTAVALAAITGKPTELHNIRARRSRPGLQAQHLTAVKAAGILCAAELHGAELGSQFLRFVPTQAVKPGNYDFDVAEARAGGSAGATGLVLQTVALPLVVAPAQTPSTVTISGGTHVPMSPSADFIAGVFLPALHRMGAMTQFVNPQAGFYPRGGGIIRLTLLSPFTEGITLTERGRLKRFTAVITTAELPDAVGERGVAALRKELSSYSVPVVPQIQRLPSSGAGASVVLVAECEKTVEGWQSLGEKGKPMEQVAADAARAFKKWYATGCATDEHLADQLVLPASLAPGMSRWTTAQVSDHLRTVIAVVPLFLERAITLDEQSDGSGTVTIGA